jgi:predicted oxidoreductase
MSWSSLHANGPVFSRTIAGVWRWHALSVAQIDALVREALDLGITTFDHADIYGNYGNEQLFGEALKKSPELARQIQIVTKCGIKLVSPARPAHHIKHYDTSPEHIIESVNTSLSVLGVEKIDLLLLHRPDPLLDVHQVAEAFGQLRQQGKVLYFGVSNFSPAQFDLLQAGLGFPLVTNQIEISLVHHRPLFDGSVDHLYRLGVSPMAWSPLGGGKALEELWAAPYRGMQVAAGLQQKYNATLSQLQLAWLLAHPSRIFPVVGTTKAARLAEAAAAENIRLERQDWFDLLRWVTGSDVP